MTGTLITKIASKSDKTKQHQIRRGADQVIYCTCQSWKYRGYCTHLETYKTEQADLASQWD